MGAVQRFGDAATRRALDELHDKGLNFDSERRGEFTPQNGWHVDNYRQPLPPGPPGQPLPDGSWRAAQRLMRDYEFADPSLIRAIYYPDCPLEQRDILLEGRFLGLPGPSRDGTDGLRGLEVARHREVEFRIQVVSKPAHMPDPVIRLGFRLFGRTMQRRFARHACRRMAQLTSAALRRGTRREGAEAPPRVGKLTVAPAASQPGTQQRLARQRQRPDDP
jgi:hypothetical protein